MTAKQTFHWIRTVGGTCALVDNEERDRLTPLGWQEVTEPDPGDFVYMHKTGIDVPGLFAYSGAATWQGEDWAFGPPPQRIDVTKDPVADPAPKAQKTTRPAAGAAENTKE